MIPLWTREQHSPDGTSYIDGSRGRWLCVFHNVPLATFFRREDARQFMRSAKAQALQKLQQIVGPRALMRSERGVVDLLARAEATSKQNRQGPMTDAQRIALLERTLQRVSKLLEDDLERGYVLTYEPMAGELWRQRRIAVLADIDAALDKTKLV